MLTWPLSMNFREYFRFLTSNMVGTRHFTLAGNPNKDPTWQLLGNYFAWACQPLSKRLLIDSLLLPGRAKRFSFTIDMGALSRNIHWSSESSLTKRWKIWNQVSTEVPFSNASGLAWDKDGDLLAVICEKNPIIILWDSNRKRIVQLDSSFK